MDPCECNITTEALCRLMRYRIMPSFKQLSKENNNKWQQPSKILITGRSFFLSAKGSIQSPRRDEFYFILYFLSKLIISAMYVNWKKYRKQTKRKQTGLHVDNAWTQQNLSSITTALSLPLGWQSKQDEKQNVVNMCTLTILLAVAVRRLWWLYLHV